MWKRTISFSLFLIRVRKIKIVRFDSYNPALPIVLLLQKKFQYFFFLLLIKKKSNQIIALLLWSSRYDRYLMSSYIFLKNGLMAHLYLYDTKRRKQFPPIRVRKIGNFVVLRQTKKKLKFLMRTNFCADVIGPNTFLSCPVVTSRTYINLS